MSMKFYVVVTYSGYEKKAETALLEKIQTEGAEDQFGEILIPVETVEEVVRGKKRVGERKFYPGYIFVEMIMNEKNWHLVTNTSRITSFIGGKNPAPVPNKEIESIKNQMTEGAEKPKTIIRFEEGDEVKIIDGAFNGFSGLVREVKSDKQKVVIHISIFGRLTPVELGYTQVEQLQQ